MKKAGCAFIGYGLESASPTVLESMNKKTKVEDITNALKLTEEVKIGFQGNFIFGDIAETPKTIQETSNFYNKYCKNHLVYIGYVTPYHGSQLIDYSIENKIISNKKEYYENISHFGQKSFNMTKMPDSTFYPLIDKIININSKLDDFKTAAVISQQFEKIEDSSLPIKWRTKLYQILLTCPHCYKEND